MKWQKENICKSIHSPALCYYEIHFFYKKKAISFFSDYSNNTCLLLKIQSDIEEESKNYTKSPTLRKPDCMCRHNNPFMHTHLGQSPSIHIPPHWGFRNVASWGQWGVRRNLLKGFILTLRMDHWKKLAVFLLAIVKYRCCFQRNCCSHLDTSLEKANSKKWVKMGESQSVILIKTLGRATLPLDFPACEPINSLIVCMSLISWYLKLNAS